MFPVPPAPSGSHAPRGRGDAGSLELGLGAWRTSVVQGDARPPPACPRLLGTARRTAGALWVHSESYLKLTLNDKEKTLFYLIFLQIKIKEEMAFSESDIMIFFFFSFLYSKMKRPRIV